MAERKLRARADTADIRSLTRWLVDLSGRLARFEPVDPDEIARFHAATDELLEAE